MAAPEYVPRPKLETTRVYESPPWSPEPWVADRPGDLSGPAPRGARFGSPGPDQGYVLRLVRRVADDFVLDDGEDHDDAVVGCAAVALKRASLYGRAPVIHDVRVAATIWGLLGEAPAELVALRTRELAGISHPHHESARRRVADLVPPEALRRTPAEVRQMAATDWRSLFRRDDGVDDAGRST